MNVPSRLLGNTGLEVSALSMGTVALGVSYGIDDGSAPPSRTESIALIQSAFESGITLFDTAPNYGDAEALVGEALKNHPEALIASKVSIPKDVPEGLSRAAAITQSFDRSRCSLQRDVIDIIQVHNLTATQASANDIADGLLALKHQGWVRAIGASVYTEEEAIAAIESGWVEVLQVAFNLLDQRMANCVFSMAHEKGIGVLTRSAYLKGALTPRVGLLPASMNPLRKAVEKLSADMDIALEDMPAAALAFCLGEPTISSVLIGPSTQSELKAAWNSNMFDRARTLNAAGKMHAINQPELVDPRRWPIN
ncbi:MAG: aldo/keto reductase [Betaproteobacteria bacterium]|nr:aldo/keto reductase [Betaproteobacteria bacterium]